jgi:hypothetical protein
MVSLIHDGLGEALLEWAKDYGTRDRAWAMYSLTAPMGASHMWHEDDQMWVEPDGTEGKMQGELSGDEGRPIVLGNLVFKGNSILGAQFKHTVFLNCDFRGTLFLDCSFAGVTFVNCQLDGALFSDCTIIGQPDPATCVPIDHDIEKSIPDNPQFNVPYAPELARTFRRYREEGPGATVYLVSREAGRPAYASDTALTEGAGWLSWTPARAGLAMYGGRVSALTFRGTVFQDGRIAFRGVIGTGLDLAELDGADFEFHRCVLRHVAFSTGNDRTSGTIKVVVDFTVAVQWWFGNSLEGSMTTRKSRLLHLWNDSRNVRVSIDDPEKTTQTMGPESRDYPTSGDLSGVVALTEYRRGRHLAE